MQSSMKGTGWVDVLVRNTFISQLETKRNTTDSWIYLYHEAQSKYGGSKLPLGIQTVSSFHSHL